MENIFIDSMHTPYGILHLAAAETGLIRIQLPSADTVDSGTLFKKLYPDAKIISDKKRLAEAADELHAYFTGKIRTFSCSLDIRGTDFQKKIWKTVHSVPYGKTASYSAIAEAAGKPGAARAAGRANHSNPLPVIIPCHRVIGKNGALTGYGGGIELKQTLLDFEKEVIRNDD